MKRLLVLACLVMACSSSTESGVAPGTDASSDTKSETSGEGGACVNPHEGDPCAMGDTLCPGNEGGCCVGYVWQCQDGAWKKLGLGCACLPDAGPDGDAESDAIEGDAGPFACGSTSCTGSEICKTQESGIDGGTSSKSCAAIPAGCEATPTCECVKTKLSGCVPATCTDDGKGHVTISCMGA
jgi:hypothetical protein